MTKLIYAIMENAPKVDIFNRALPVPQRRSPFTAEIGRVCIALAYYFVLTCDAQISLEPLPQIQNTVWIVYCNHAPSSVIVHFGLGRPFVKLVRLKIPYFGLALIIPARIMAKHRSFRLSLMTTTYQSPWNVKKVSLLVELREVR